jgi:uncharacterized membrane protein YgcG
METSPIEVQKALKGMDYPAKKKDLIEKARENDASKEVMQVLENLPEKEFENAVDVSKEFGEGGGGRGGHQGGGSRGGQKQGGQKQGGRGHKKEE